MYTLTVITIVIMVFQLKEYGIKGPSWLSTIPHYDLIRGTSIDYMHCILLGVCKQVIKLWTQSKYHKELWYIGNNTVDVNERLLAIKPPCEIQRTPRSFESLKYWKGKNMCTYLLIYSCRVTRYMLIVIVYVCIVVLYVINLLLESCFTQSNCCRSISRISITLTFQYRSP